MLQWFTHFVLNLSSKETNRVKWAIYSLIVIVWSIWKKSVDDVHQSKTVWKEKRENEEWSIIDLNFLLLTANKKVLKRKPVCLLLEFAFYWLAKVKQRPREKSIFAWIFSSFDWCQQIDFNIDFNEHLQHHLSSTITRFCFFLALK